MIFLKWFFLSALPSSKGIFQREGKSQSKNPNLEVVDGIEKKTEWRDSREMLEVILTGLTEV